jgi:hypothetical protein
LAISFLLCLQPQGDLELVLQGLGLPIDDDFPDKFFNAFFPGQRLENNGFWDKFWSAEYCKEEMSKIFIANGSFRFYFRFTEIEGGYLGMAPRFSPPGNVVAILKGCKAPVIIRKREDYYTHIGPSIIPGFVEGEAKELYKNGRARFEKI